MSSDVGYSYGDLIGRWIAGPSEASIGDAVSRAPEDSDFYSWSWILDPALREEGDAIERAASRSAALELLTSWRVAWCPADRRAATSRFLFDSTEWASTAEEHTDMLRPGAVGSHRGPLKLLSRRSARSLTRDLVGESYLSLRGEALTDELDRALFESGRAWTIAPRLGVLVETQEEASGSSVAGMRTWAHVMSEIRRSPAAYSRSAYRRISVQVDPDHVVAALVGTDLCLAVVNAEAATRNTLTPADPWLSVPV